MSIQNPHAKALRALVRFEDPLSALQEQYSGLPHDHDGEPVVMTKAHLAHALRRCIDGEITVRDLETWADLVEGRPGIDYEPGYEEAIANTLFQLSTPEINEPITTGFCWRLLKELHEEGR